MQLVYYIDCIGRSLAEEFLRAGDSVVISSRSAANVQKEVQLLTEKYGEGRVVGIDANVSLSSSPFFIPSSQYKYL